MNTGNRNLHAFDVIAFAKLYTTKTPIAAADVLNDRVLPFYQEHQVPLLRVSMANCKSAAGND